MCIAGFSLLKYILQRLGGFESVTIECLFFSQLFRDCFPWRIKAAVNKTKDSRDLLYRVSVKTCFYTHKTQEYFIKSFCAVGCCGFQRSRVFCRLVLKSEGALALRNVQTRTQTFIDNSSCKKSRGSLWFFCSPAGYAAFAFSYLRSTWLI